MKANASRGWFFVADGGSGKLYRTIVVPPGRRHLQQHGTIRNEVPASERGRPSALRGKNGNSYASVGHDAEEDLHRFAKEVAAWLDRKLEQHAVAELTVFCAPRFLGELRRVWCPSAERRVTLRQGDLTSFEASALVHHPAVEELAPGSGDPLPVS